MVKPKWWLLYIGLGLYALVALSHAFVGDNRPASAKSVFFWPSEVNGRECKDMADEAAKLSAEKWSCIITNSKWP